MWPTLKMGGISVMFRALGRHIKEAYLGITRHFAMSLSAASAVTVTLLLMSKILADQGINKNKILNALKNIRGKATVNNQEAENNYKVLEKYSTDLTKLAREGKLDPVIGRDEEIRRVIQVLNRKNTFRQGKKLPEGAL